MGADTLFRVIMFEPKRHERVQPVKNQRGNLMYTIKDCTLESLICDDNRAYLLNRNNKRFYEVSINKGCISAKTVHFSDNKGFYFKGEFRAEFFFQNNTL